MQFSFVHDFDIDVANYWRIFLSEPFNVDMFKQLNMKEYKVLERTDDGKVFHRVQSLEPNVKIPAFVSAMISSTAYIETDHLVWSTNSMDISIEYPRLRDRFSMKGQYIVAPLGDKRCRREFRGEIKVSAPLVGGKIEKYIMEQMRDSYDKASQVTRDWIAKDRAGQG